MCREYLKEASRCTIQALLEVRFHHPGIASAWARAGPGRHGLPRTHLRAIPVPTPPAVRRVAGVAAARHGPWQARVFSGGQAPRTRRPIPWGHRVSADECGAGPLLLQAFYEAVDGLVQGRCLCLGTPLVPPSGGLLPDVAPALLQAGLVEPPRAGAEPLALWPCRLLRSAPQGGWHGVSAPARSGHVAWAGSVCRSAPSPCARLSRLGVRGAALTPSPSAAPLAGGLPEARPPGTVRASHVRAAALHASHALCGPRQTCGQRTTTLPLWRLLERDNPRRLHAPRSRGGVQLPGGRSP